MNLPVSMQWWLSFKCCTTDHFSGERAIFLFGHSSTTRICTTNRLQWRRRHNEMRCDNQNCTSLADLREHNQILSGMRSESQRVQSTGHVVACQQIRPLPRGCRSFRMWKTYFEVSTPEEWPWGRRLYNAATDGLWPFYIGHRSWPFRYCRLWPFMICCSCMCMLAYEKVSPTMWLRPLWLSALNYTL